MYIYLFNNSNLKYYTRNSQIKTVAYENSCLQIVLKMKRDGFRDKYTKPKRKEAKTVDKTTTKKEATK